MKKRIISLLLIAVLGLTLLCGCTQYAITSDLGDLESAKMGYYSFYVHWQRDYFKELLKNQGVDLTANLDSYYTSTETVRQAIVSSAKKQYISFVIVTEKFKELGLSLTAEQNAALENQYNNEWVQIYGESGMKNILGKLDLSKEEFLNLLALQVKSDAIIEYYYGQNGQNPISEQDKKDFYAKNFFRFKYILLSTVDEKNKALSSDEIAAKRKLANELDTQIKNGTKIESLIEQYSEDYVKITDKMTADEKKVAEENNLKAVTDGIICDGAGVFNFTLHSVYNISVDNKIVLLLATMKDGDSAVVETDNSIWVIQKFDVNEKEEYYTSRAETVYQTMYSDDFNAKYTRWQGELNYKFDDAVLEELDPGNFNDLFSEVYKEEK